MEQENELVAAPVQAVVLRPSVQRFSEMMELRLRENEHKTPWPEVHYRNLADDLTKNLRKLRTECQKPFPDRVEIARRAANVANFAMMLDDNATHERLYGG